MEVSTPRNLSCWDLPYHIAGTDHKFSHCTLAQAGSMRTQRKEWDSRLLTTIGLTSGFWKNVSGLREARMEAKQSHHDCKKSTPLTANFQSVKLSYPRVPTDPDTMRQTWIINTRRTLNRFLKQRLTVYTSSGTCNSAGSCSSSEE